MRFVQSADSARAVRRMILRTLRLRVDQLMLLDPTLSEANAIVLAWHQITAQQPVLAIAWAESIAILSRPNVGDLNGTGGRQTAAGAAIGSTGTEPRPKPSHRRGRPNATPPWPFVV